MEKRNYILKIEMSDEEAATFARITPLIGISINEGEANFIARLLGYKSAKSLIQTGFKENPYLSNAYIALSFLYLSRGDKIIFDDFWNRIVFCDKAVEKKTKRAFNIQEDDDSLSSLQLELMWMLETDKDEWADTK